MPKLFLSFSEFDCFDVYPNNPRGSPIFRVGKIDPLGRFRIPSAATAVRSRSTWGLTLLEEMGAHLHGRPGHGGPGYGLYGALKIVDKGKKRGKDKQDAIANPSPSFVKKCNLRIMRSGSQLAAGLHSLFCLKFVSVFHLCLVGAFFSLAKRCVFDFHSKSFI